MGRDGRSGESVRTSIDLLGRRYVWRNRRHVRSWIKRCSTILKLLVLFKKSSKREVHHVLKSKNEMIWTHLIKFCLQAYEALVTEEGRLKLLDTSPHIRSLVTYK